MGEFTEKLDFHTRIHKQRIACYFEELFRVKETLHRCGVYETWNVCQEKDREWIVTCSRAQWTYGSEQRTIKPVTDYDILARMLDTDRRIQETDGFGRAKTLHIKLNEKNRRKLIENAGHCKIYCGSTSAVLNNTILAIAIVEVLIDRASAKTKYDNAEYQACVNELIKDSPSDADPIMGMLKTEYFTKRHEFMAKVSTDRANEIEELERKSQDDEELACKGVDEQLAILYEQKQVIRDRIQRETLAKIAEVKNKYDKMIYEFDKENNPEAISKTRTRKPTTIKADESGEIPKPHAKRGKNKTSTEENA